MTRDDADVADLSLMDLDNERYYLERRIRAAEETVALLDDLRNRLAEVEDRMAQLARAIRQEAIA